MESTRNHTRTEKSDINLRFDLDPLPGRSMVMSPQVEPSQPQLLKSHDMTMPTSQNDTRLSDVIQSCSDEAEDRAMCISPAPRAIGSSAGTAIVLTSPSEEEQPMESDQKMPFISFDDAATSKPTEKCDPEWNDPHCDYDETQCDRSANQPSNDRREEENSTICLRDIVGHAAVKLRIDELLLPLGLPDSVTETVLTGIRSTPPSILLYGPPGCGKTKLVQALAGEAQAALVSIAPSDVLSKFVGDSESSIRNIFRKAVEQAMRLPSQCAVVFFDEIDALGQSRGNMGTGEGEGCSRRVLAELLLQLNVIASRKYLSIRDFGGSNHNSHAEREDTVSGTLDQAGASSQNGRVRIIVAAATNRLEDIDPALVRRFGIQLEVGLPEYKDRKKMLSRHLVSVLHNMSVDEFHTLASATEGWSGSNIEDLARAAAMRPVHECLHHAAVLRRRAGKLEQRGGDYSGQDDSPESSDLMASSYLIGAVQSLRPVTLEDFGSAIRVMTNRELPVSFPPFLKANKKRIRDEHYDSSSSDSESM